MATINTPVEGFSGVVVGVTFTDGVGESDDAAALQYFDRHGYTVEQEAIEDTGDTLPAGNASTEVWIAYALAHGTTPDELEGKGRDEIRDLITNKPTE